MDTETKNSRPPGPSHELVRLKTGALSLRHRGSGEVMHSNVGPEQEATLLYIEQSRLRERLAQATAGAIKSPLVLFDVGLGAGTNALAALTAWQNEKKQDPGIRSIQLISFENDLTGLELALKNKDDFPFFNGFEDAVKALLRDHEWKEGDLSWELRKGDFMEHASRGPSPDIIFFDFYSPKTDPSLWGVPTFELLSKTSHHRTTLYTYSASTRVRVALLLAGFFVGYGRSTGAKRDTTAAAKHLGDLERPLDDRWLRRFMNSHEPLPHGWSAERFEQLRALILDHPQFKK